MSKFSAPSTVRTSCIPECLRPRRALVFQAEKQQLLPGTEELRPRRTPDHVRSKMSPAVDKGRFVVFSDGSSLVRSRPYRRHAS